VTFDLQSLSDGELAALTLAGRHSAYAEIMKRHRDVIYRLARGHVGDRDDALDVVQETFTSAYRALERYDHSRPMRAWLSRIAINKCRDWSRRRAVRRFMATMSLTSEAVDEVPDSSPRIDDAVADREQLELLWAAVAALPRNLKEPLILRTIDGLSQAEAAGVLGISEKAVETRVYRARAKLTQFRSILEQDPDE
jgi:RNA polymerase sigma factor (sigma-70 family)